MNRLGAHCCAWLGGRSKVARENSEAQTAAILAVWPAAIRGDVHLIRIERDDLVRVDAWQAYVQREVVPEGLIEQHVGATADDESRGAREVSSRRLALEMENPVLRLATQIELAV